MDIDQLRQQAYQSASQAANIQTSSPGLLSQLKENLVGIFSKNNPVMKARDVALSDYLSTPARARADLLPTNLPEIEGRNLALSPTQQNAITTSRSSAALAPLAGFNEVIKAMYGNIGEAVQGAGTIYDAQTRAAQSSASNLLELYKAAIAEEEAKKSSGGLGADLASLIAALTQDLKIDQSLDDIFGIPANIKKTTKSPNLVQQAAKKTKLPNLPISNSLLPFGLSGYESSPLNKLGFNPSGIGSNINY